MQTNNIRGFIIRLKDKLDYYGLAQLKKAFDITDEELTEMCKLDKDFKKLMLAKGFVPLEVKEPKKEVVQEPVKAEEPKKKVKTTSKKKASK